MLEIVNYLMNYKFDNGCETKLDTVTINHIKTNRYTNEFWTAKQRQASSIHEVSYRACFKPQLPSFFIKWLTKENDVVYDPFNGRGTTSIEAGLLGRNIVFNDINPISKIFTKSRLLVPEIKDVENRLYSISIDYDKKSNIDLSMFYHSKTESELVSLKEYLNKRNNENTEDYLDRWIRMIATNRLTGHSTGFFSVYTLPPNQAISQKRQKRINKKRKQNPTYKDVIKLILKKSKSLMRTLSPEDIDNLKRAYKTGLFLNTDSRHTYEIPKESVQLTVTSPPFLDVVQYSDDNWLRFWFNSISQKDVSENITMSKTIEDWSFVMGDVLKELYRITKHDGWVAFEVGEVKNGKINLDEYIVPLGIDAGFKCEGILVNLQNFTKTSNIWGVKNNKKGTNTNRIVMFRK